jgi:prepilin-type N-terminal cleavage/methylation domain-containing protein
MGLQFRPSRSPSNSDQADHEPRIRQARGYTFVELLVVSAIIIVLASVAMPLAR